jgi:4-hydroxy-3-methylbut-2-enyl diphosphate reductase
MTERLHVILANPRGFCAGVERAVQFVERALDILGSPLYVRHEIVHNRHVVQSLSERGAIFVDQLDAVPDRATVMFSAHGVSPAVKQEAHRRGLQVLDATCPLVSKVHLEVTRHARDGCELALIGHEGHAEVLGISGHYRSGGGRRLHLVQAPHDVAALAIDDAARIAYAIQTTYSVDEAAPIVAALTERFPAIRAPRSDDICYATQSRQNAVRALARQCDLILVIGSSTSANSRRLQETAQRAGCRAHLLDTAEDLQAGWFDGCTRVGITAGASTPEKLVQQVIDRLTHWRCCTIESDGQPPEAVVFQLPQAFRQRLEEPDLAGTSGRVERTLR